MAARPLVLGTATAARRLPPRRRRPCLLVRRVVRLPAYRFCGAGPFAAGPYRPKPFCPRLPGTDPCFERKSNVWPHSSRQHHTLAGSGGDPIECDQPTISGSIFKRPFCWPLASETVGRRTGGRFLFRHFSTGGRPCPGHRLEDGFLDRIAGGAHQLVCHPPTGRSLPEMR